MLQAAFARDRLTPIERTWMSFSRKTLGLLAGTALLLPLTSVAPAAAAAAQCVTLPVGPTPEIAIHTTGPDPEVHVQSVSDVTLCVDSNVVLSDAPTIEREQCGGFGSCMKYYVGYSVRGSAEATATLCYVHGGQQTCHSVPLPPVVADAVQPGQTCVGYDLRGGDPCQNFSWFE